MPKVTVLMSVYNGENYLVEAIESILKQTYRDFEFLIIDDGSYDDSGKIIADFRKKDNRIRVIKNRTNKGLPFSLNKGIKESKSEYIVRMDADDVSLPERLRVLVSYLDSHPDIDLCGSAIILWQDGRDLLVKYPRDDEVIKAQLIFHDSIAHPAVAMRTKSLIFHNLFYNLDFTDYPCEDYELWTRSCWLLKMANLPEPLLYYRVHPKKRSRSSSKLITGTNLVRKKILEKIGLKNNKSELIIHNDIATQSFTPSLRFLYSSYQWLLKIRNYNLSRGYFAQPALEKVLEEQWYNVCSQSTNLGFPVWNNYLRPCLVGNWPTSMSHLAIITLKTLRYELFT